MLLVLGNPLVDISLQCDVSLLAKYNLPLNGSVEVTESNSSIFNDIRNVPGAVINPGGTALNTALVANWIMRSGNRVVFIGALGNDDMGLFVKHEAMRHGLKSHFQVVTNGATGTVAILITPDHQRTMCSNMKASKSLDFQFLEKPGVKESMELSTIVYTVGYFVINHFENIFKFIKNESKRGKRIALNLSAVFICRDHSDKLRLILPYVDIVMCNNDEAIAFANTLDEKQNEPSNVIGDFYKHNPKLPRIVVVTDGDKPVTLYEGSTNSKSFPVPALHKIVDTTGAGDAFVGGFLASLIIGKKIDEALEVGIKCSAKIIQQQGCAPPLEPYE